MAEQIFTSSQYKTQAKPASNPPAGFTETYFDSDNGGQLTTLFPNGDTIVLPVTHATLTARDTADSHPASAISYDDGTETPSDVQTQIQEIRTILGDINAALTTILGV